jgi:hypothetical protein
VLILTIPFSNYAQYLGGNGRGDVSIILTNVPLPIEEAASSLPARFELAQNYPNPFNPSTKIKFSIPRSDSPLLGGARGGFVTLKIYDVLGNEIATLVNEEKHAGTYEVYFNSTDLPSGIYLYRLQANNNSLIKKMVLLK